MTIIQFGIFGLVNKVNQVLGFNWRIILITQLMNEHNKR